MLLTQANSNLQAGAYLANIEALTVKGEVGGSLNPQASVAEFSWLFSPWLVYGCVGLFFTLFILALAIQIKSRVLDWRRTTASLTVALLIAAVPLTMRTFLQITTLESHASPDEVPRAIQIQQLSPRSVQISWQTDAPKTAVVRYGIAPLSDTNSQTEIVGGGIKTQTHSIILMNLLAGNSYEFEILSGNTWFNDNGKPLQFQLTP